MPPPSMQQMLSPSSGGGNVLAYPTEASADNWHYTNFVEFIGYNYGTNQRTLDKIIRLPLPEDLQISLNPNWSIERSAEGIAMDALKAIPGALNEAILGTSAKVLGGSMNILGSKNGFLMNPFMQAYFKFVTFRTIDFSWTLSAKTAEDTGIIIQLVNTFKYMSLPDIPHLGGIIMTYPSEFDISFLFNYPDAAAAQQVKSSLQQASTASGGDGNVGGGGNMVRNPALFAMDRCVITNINLNYSPAGAYSNFHNGAPVEVGLQISFQEINMLTRAKYRDIVARTGVAP